MYKVTWFYRPETCDPFSGGDADKTVETVAELIDLLIHIQDENNVVITTI